jgi:drug/metabolite transporter (DMT)-like permease
MTICFTIVFTYIIFGQTAPPKAVNAALVVLAGVVLGSIGEERFTWHGLSYGILSSLFVSLYGIFAKQLLAELGQWYRDALCEV